MNKTIGEFIAELRRARGLTQKELASKLGVSDKAVSRWERNESLPDLYMAADIADFFGISADELLHRSTSVSAKKPDADEKAQLDKNEMRRLRDERAILMMRTKYKDLLIHSWLVCAVSVIAFVADVMLSDIDRDAARLFSFVVSALLVVYQVVTALKINGYVEARDAVSDKASEAKAEFGAKLYRTSAVSVGVIITVFVLMLCWLHLGDWLEFAMCGAFFAAITALGCLILALIIKCLLKKKK